jgi:hypothetical protein
MPPITGASFSSALFGGSTPWPHPGFSVFLKLPRHFWKCLIFKYYLIYNIPNLGNDEALKKS